MSRKKKNLPLYEKVTISGIAAEGKAVARIDNMVCFVGLAAPGDVADIRIKRKRSSYMEGVITHFHSYSKDRAKPFCNHFGICGGCKWQHIPYSGQLKFKQQQVEDALKRIAKIELPEIYPIMGSKKETGYRNKMEYTFSPYRWIPRDEIEMGNEITDFRAVGFHVPGMFDKIVDIEKCWLQEEPGNQIRDHLKNYAKHKDLPFYNPRTHQGFMRNLIIRNSTSGELMVIVVVADENKDEPRQMLTDLLQAFPDITSLYYVVNKKVNDTLYDQEMVLIHGKEFITEKMEDLYFRIGPKSFFQTNSLQAYELYKTARDFADLRPGDLVYDLYTGTGTIAQFVAGKVSKVIGIESVPEAISDARINAELNGIQNCSFYAGDILELLSESFFRTHGSPDVIITDPPRAGMHEKVTRQLLSSGARTIVYVSCNPASQARDLAILGEAYRLTRVQPVDMFPHTHHVENVVRLDRKE